jgi:hypothetical protein
MATSNDAWLTISSGSSGTGNGTVNFNVAANTGPARTGTLTIAGQTFTVNQASGCVYMLSATNQNAVAAGVTGSVSVTANVGCAWTAISNAVWLTISSGSNGTGNGTVNFTVAANTGAARTGTLTIAGQTFTVNQDAEQTLCVAQRTLPTEYIPGLGFVVSIQASPVAGTQSYAVEDTPPTGWTVSGIDNGGQFDATNGKVKWGPFFDAQARTLTYLVTPPGGSSGQRTFNGTISVDGVSSAICGSSSIQAGNFVHLEPPAQSH